MVRNTGSLLVGQGGRIALQATYFVLLAHGLGVSDYGAFAGILAAVSIVSPFSTLGTINLLIRDAAVDAGGVATYYATTRAIAWIGGLVMVVALVSLSHFLLPEGVPLWVFVCIAIAEVIAARLIEVASAAFQGLRRMNSVARLQLLLPSVRCVVAGIVVFGIDDMGLDLWAVIFLMTAVACSVVTAWVARRALGKGRPWVGHYMRQWRQGALFSVSLASQSAYNDLDKAMLSSLGSPTANGIYSAAYRVVEIGFAPMRALLSAAYP